VPYKRKRNFYRERPEAGGIGAAGKFSEQKNREILDLRTPDVSGA